MRIIRSQYLNDGKRFNDGRPAELIRIENPADYDRLLANILDSGYYDREYFEEHMGYRAGTVGIDRFCLACLTAFLQPASVLELGCGRGDVLFLLGLDGRTRVSGVELSRAALDQAWSELEGRIFGGDILEAAASWAGRARPDTCLAFDIFEHLHPGRLDEYIEAVVQLSRPEALFFFLIPAFGPDRVFGEVFPLEFEANRARFEAGQPFDHLLLERAEPAIPANGHLIWAPSQWWQARFEEHGLVRVEELEANLHAHFDDHLHPNQRAFYLFRRDSAPARERVEALFRARLKPRSMWRLTRARYRLVQNRQKALGREIIDNRIAREIVNIWEARMLRSLGQDLAGDLGGLLGPRLGPAVSTRLAGAGRAVAAPLRRWLRGGFRRP